MIEKKVIILALASKKYNVYKKNFAGFLLYATQICCKLFSSHAIFISRLIYEKHLKI